MYKLTAIIENQITGMVEGKYLKQYIHIHTHIKQFQMILNIWTTLTSRYKSQEAVLVLGS